MAPTLEVAGIFRRHGEAFRQAHAGHLGYVERRIMGAITACRTAALGGHVEACDDCGASRIAYNSCRNRHCPKCQTAARETWLADRQAELLPVPYFHLVFTLPAPIAEIAFQNKAVVYAILFKAALEAMTILAANPRRLGAQVGGLAVLHTWGQTLMHHPHVHCVVPGGGLSPDGKRWIAGRANFFLAVKPLAMLFRRLFLKRLQGAFEAGALAFFGDLAHVAQPAGFAAHIARPRRIDWVVYAKKPFGGPAQVLAYLGRYTHRVAISNSRIKGRQTRVVPLAAILRRRANDGRKRKIIDARAESGPRRATAALFPVRRRHARCRLRSRLLSTPRRARLAISLRHIMTATRASTLPTARRVKRGAPMIDGADKHARLRARRAAIRRDTQSTLSPRGRTFNAIPLHGRFNIPRASARQRPDTAPHS